MSEQERFCRKCGTLIPFYKHETVKVCDVCDPRQMKGKARGLQPATLAKIKEAAKHVKSDSRMTGLALFQDKRYPYNFFDI